MTVSRSARHVPSAIDNSSPNLTFDEALRLAKIAFAPDVRRRRPRPSRFHMKGKHNQKTHGHGFTGVGDQVLVHKTSEIGTLVCHQGKWIELSGTKKKWFEAHEITIVPPPVQATHTPPSGGGKFHAEIGDQVSLPGYTGLHTIVGTPVPGDLYYSVEMPNGGIIKAWHEGDLAVANPHMTGQIAASYPDWYDKSGMHNQEVKLSHGETGKVIGPYLGPPGSTGVINEVLVLVGGETDSSAALVYGIGYLQSHNPQFAAVSVAAIPPPTGFPTSPTSADHKVGDHVMYNGEEHTVTHAGPLGIHLENDVSGALVMDIGHDEVTPVISSIAPAHSSPTSPHFQVVADKLETAGFYASGVSPNGQLYLFEHLNGATATLEKATGHVEITNELDIHQTLHPADVTPATISSAISLPSPKPSVGYSSVGLTKADLLEGEGFYYTGDSFTGTHAKFGHANGAEASLDKTNGDMIITSSAGNVKFLNAANSGVVSISDATHAGVTVLPTPSSVAAPSLTLSAPMYIPNIGDGLSVPGSPGFWTVTDIHPTGDVTLTATGMPPMVVGKSFVDKEITQDPLNSHLVTQSLGSPGSFWAGANHSVDTLQIEGFDVGMPSANGSVSLTHSNWASAAVEPDGTIHILGSTGTMTTLQPHEVTPAAIKSAMGPSVSSHHAVASQKLEDEGFVSTSVDVHYTTFEHPSGASAVVEKVSGIMTIEDLAGNQIQLQPHEQTPGNISLHAQIGPSAPPDPYGLGAGVSVSPASGGAHSNHGTAIEKLEQQGFNFTTYDDLSTTLAHPGGASAVVWKSDGSMTMTNPLGAVQTLAPAQQSFGNIAVHAGFTNLPPTHPAHAIAATALENHGFELVDEIVTHSIYDHPDGAQATISKATGIATITNPTGGQTQLASHQLTTMGIVSAAGTSSVSPHTLPATKKLEDIGFVADPQYNDPSYIAFKHPNGSTATIVTDTGMMLTTHYSGSKSALLPSEQTASQLLSATGASAPPAGFVPLPSSAHPPIKPALNGTAAIHDSKLEALGFEFVGGTNTLNYKHPATPGTAHLTASTGVVTINPTNMIGGGVQLPTPVSHGTHSLDTLAQAAGFANAISAKSAADSANQFNPSPTPTVVAPVPPTSGSVIKPAMSGNIAQYDSNLTSLGFEYTGTSNGQYLYSHPAGPVALIDAGTQEMKLGDSLGNDNWLHPYEKDDISILASLSGFDSPQQGIYHAMMATGSANSPTLGSTGVMPPAIAFHAAGYTDETHLSGGDVIYVNPSTGDSLNANKTVGKIFLGAANGSHDVSNMTFPEIAQMVATLGGGSPSTPTPPPIPTTSSPFKIGDKVVNPSGSPYTVAQVHPDGTLDLTPFHGSAALSGISPATLGIAKIPPIGTAMPGAAHIVQAPLGPNPAPVMQPSGKSPGKWDVGAQVMITTGPNAGETGTIFEVNDLGGPGSEVKIDTSGAYKWHPLDTAKVMEMQVPGGHSTGGITNGHVGFTVYTKYGPALIENFVGAGTGVSSQDKIHVMTETGMSKILKQKDVYIKEGPSGIPIVVPSVGATAITPKGLGVISHFTPDGKYAYIEGVGAKHWFLISEINSGAPVPGSNHANLPPYAHAIAAQSSGVAGMTVGHKVVGSHPPSGTYVPSSQIRSQPGWTAHRAATIAQLTTAERQRVKLYTDSWANTINTQIWDAHKAGTVKNVTPSMKLLDDAIKKSITPIDIMLWRKSSIKQSASHQPGTILEHPGYSSSTTSKSFAAAYGNSVTMHIRVPKGSSVLDVWKNVSQHDIEEEMILPRASRYKILEIKIESNGSKYYEVELIP